MKVQQTFGSIDVGEEFEYAGHEFLKTNNPSNVNNAVMLKEKSKSCGFRGQMWHIGECTKVSVEAPAISFGILKEGQKFKWCDKLWYRVPSTGLSEGNIRFNAISEDGKVALFGSKDDVYGID